MLSRFTATLLIIVVVTQFLQRLTTTFYCHLDGLKSLNGFINSSTSSTFLLGYWGVIGDIGVLMGGYQGVIWGVIWGVIGIGGLLECYQGVTNSPYQVWDWRIRQVTSNHLDSIEVNTNGAANAKQVEVSLNCLYFQP